MQAAADGEVVYAGSGLAGYGQLLIIRHNPSWLSAYGHNEELLVREGDRVRAGQQIARMGAGAGRQRRSISRFAVTASRSIRCASCRHGR